MFIDMCPCLRLLSIAKTSIFFSQPQTDENTNVLRSYLKTSVFRPHSSSVLLFLFAILTQPMEIVSSSLISFLFGVHPFDKPAFLRRGLFVSQGDWGEGKKSTRWAMGRRKGKERDLLPPLPLPIVPRALLILLSDGASAEEKVHFSKTAILGVWGLCTCASETQRNKDFSTFTETKRIGKL